MPVQASPEVPAPGPTLAPHADPDADPAFEARWASWIERGHRHNLAAKRHLRLAVSVLVVVAVLVALFLGLASPAA